MSDISDETRQQFARNLVIQWGGQCAHHVPCRYLRV